MDLTFHNRLRNGFLDIAKQNPDRCTVIDATQDLNTVAAEILKTARERMA